MPRGYYTIEEEDIDAIIAEELGDDLGIEPIDLDDDFFED